MLVWIVRMILLKSNGEITSSIDWSRGIDLVETAEMVVCTSRFVKMKKYLPFCKEFSRLYIDVELLLMMLPNFEREVTLKDSAF